MRRRRKLITRGRGATTKIRGSSEILLSPVTFVDFKLGVHPTGVLISP